MAVNGEIVKPDLKRMKKAFMTDLKPASEKAAKIRGDQSAAWKIVEDDYNCNKRAAKQLLRMMGESEDTVGDFLRTFLPGLVELDLIPREDIVDMMGDGVDVDAGVNRSPRRPATEGLAAVN